MFFYCTNLTELNISNLNTSKVTNMYAMFSRCENLEYVDLCDFNTESVTNMGEIFAYCYNLKELDLSNFNTSKVTDMRFMFYKNALLTTIYVSDEWTIDKVTDDTLMFDGCTSLKGAVEYNPSKINKSMANITTGYLTLKVYLDYLINAFEYPVEIDFLKFNKEDFTKILQKIKEKS